MNTVEPFIGFSRSLSAHSSETVMLGGHFNMPDVEWRDLSPVHNNRPLLEYGIYELIMNYGLFQFVD